MVMTFSRMTALAAAGVAMLTLSTISEAQRPPAAPATAELVRDARASAAAGDTAEALALLHRATDQSPRDPEALYWRGVMLVRTSRLGVGDIPDQVLAWRLLERGSSLRPREARFVLELGRLRLRTPLLRVDAERLLRRAYTLAADNAQGTVAA
jgi:Flp pilus assembly protein TadD